MVVKKINEQRLEFGKYLRNSQGPDCKQCQYLKTNRQAIDKYSCKNPSRKDSLFYIAGISILWSKTPLDKIFSILY